MRTYVATVRLNDETTRDVVVAAIDWETQGYGALSIITDYFGAGAEVESWHEQLNPWLFEVASEA
jgi:hypothetical protein